VEGLRKPNVMSRVAAIWDWSLKRKQQDNKPW
jgi:hypothetical protein